MASHKPAAVMLAVTIVAPIVGNQFGVTPPRPIALALAFLTPPMSALWRITR